MDNEEVSETMNRHLVSTVVSNEEVTHVMNRHLVSVVLSLESQIAALKREVADMSAALDFHTRQVTKLVDMFNKPVEQTFTFTSDRGGKADYAILPAHQELADMMIRAKAMKLCEGDDE